MKATIKSYCKALRLGQHIAQNYQQVEADTHEEFLEQLLRMEVENRQIARKNRYLKQAGFEIQKTFDGYSFERIQIPQAVNVEELKVGKFIERKENLILYGPVGTGKTHLLTAIGVAACNRELEVKFYRTLTLVNELVEAKENGSLKRFLKKLRRYDLLICDEWGYIPLDREGAQLLFQVVAERYENKSIALTTNLDFSQWNGIFYDEKITGAIIDRLIHHCHLLVFNGPSYRLEHSSIKA